ncbi:MAG: diphthine synthase [Nanoarchaeota archaeon]|nr:diphthine synthase [Nanoarchaeota archaeon]MBU1027814.1 diphthine synthase [Nanoarchaeota archaeon]
MLYLIGLGLNIDGISKFGLEVAKRCKRIYLETYTVDFPYAKEELQELINKKIIPADREKVENLGLVDEAKKMDVALLIYGSPLFATTHIALIQEAKVSGIRYKVIYNASVFDAIAETGLQLYKFGKIASMPGWKTNYEPTSFIKTIKDNQKINAHSLILVDIGLEFKDALNQLKIVTKNFNLKLNKIIVCSRLGTKHSGIFYDNLDNLNNLKVQKPYCIIIPSKLHFIEKEILEGLEK